MKAVEKVPCPCCGSPEFDSWAEELGFSAVRCRSCRLIYVNPRPVGAQIDAAVRTGVHGEDTGYLDVRTRRIGPRVDAYRVVFDRMFADVWRAGKPVSWLDVGAGNGEIVEAISGLAPAGSRVEGVEPMDAKASQARARGLAVTTSYLSPDHAKVDFISVVDVFSHIPQFDDFLATIRKVLKPGGQLFIETGNLADIERRDDFPGELGLPDHLVFGGEDQMRRFLDQAGFEIVSIERLRIDGPLFFIKNVVKKLIGRSVKIRAPYSSAYRRLLIRARLSADASD